MKDWIKKRLNKKQKEEVRKYSLAIFAMLGFLCGLFEPRKGME